MWLAAETWETKCPLFDISVSAAMLPCWPLGNPEDPEGCPEALNSCRIGPSSRADTPQLRFGHNSP